MGNVNTGHSDPFAELIPGCTSAAAGCMWTVRSACGPTHPSGSGTWCPEWSWPTPGATDAHKLLNAPYDSGLAICRDQADLRRATAFDAASFTTDAERPAAHLGLQMSQRARGVEMWALLASRSRTGIAALVDQLCAHASRMSDLLAAAGAEVLVPTALNQVLVRFDDDATTDAVIAAVQADRTCWAGGTTWHGLPAMRISVRDQATTGDDIETAARAIIGCWSDIQHGRSDLV